MRNKNDENVIMKPTTQIKNRFKNNNRIGR